MSAVKDLIGPAVDRLASELETLSRQIHDHPELCYQEVKAAAWLTDFLDKHGFKVEKGVAGVDTAFRATVETGEGPTIAILCEYDALPGIGHACGHNVIGTPAEEGGGGKIKLIRGGVFQDIDCAMIVHGFDRTILNPSLLGIVRA